MFITNIFLYTEKIGKYGIKLASSRTGCGVTRKYNQSINRQMRVPRSEGGGGSGVSGKHQKVSDPTLDVLLPAPNLQSLHALLNLLTLQDLL